MVMPKDIGLVIITGVLIVLSALFLVACFYAIPSADDYCYAGVFKNKGFINSQIYWYNNWSGRYIANILLSLTPVDHASVVFYRASLLIVNLSLFLAIYYLLNNIPAFYPDRASTSIASSVFVMLVSYLGYTEPVENIYWAGGVFTYQIALIFILLALATILKEVEHKAESFSKNKLIITLALFISFGLNETLSLIVLGINVFTIAYLFTIRKTVPSILYSSLVASLTFFLLVYFAPGNTVRSSVLANPNAHNMLYATLLSSKEALRLVTSTFARPETILLFITVYIYSKHHYRKHGDLPTSIKLIVPFAAILSIVIGVFASVYVTARMPPPRALGAASFIFVILLTISIILFANNDKWETINSFPSSIKLIILTIFISCTFLYSPNSRTLLRNFHNKSLSEYSDRYNTREKQIERCLENKDQECAVSRVKNSSENIIIHFADISPDKDQWINKCMANYYGIRDLRSQE
jgi:hypothetical protein